MGKTRFHAHQEIVQVAMLARHYANRGEYYLKDLSHRGVMPGLTKVREVRVPKGVIGMISPWNFPLYLGVGDVLPALLAGNGVVSKADSQTPLTLLWTLALLREAGLPEDLWQVVVGRGSVVGSALMDSADYICFTGSTRTGRLVGERTGRRLIGASLELGAKNPAIVCRDADVAAAAQGTVIGAFANAGQMCIHLERVYVDRDVYPEYAAKLIEGVRALKLGQTYEYGDEMGALASADQLATVDVAPVPIENRVVAHPKIEAACVCGANQAATLALLLLSADVRSALANGAARETLDSELSELVDAVNAVLDPHEQLEYAVVVKEPWTTDNGFLTPTMKIRRNVIEARYQPKLPGWFEARRRVIWEDCEA